MRLSEPASKMYVAVLFILVCILLGGGAYTYTQENTDARNARRALSEATAAGQTAQNADIKANQKLAAQANRRSIIEFRYLQGKGEPGLPGKNGVDGAPGVRGGIGPVGPPGKTGPT